jgi:CubicO group peptidase (beta-lactamase class C family)
MGSDSLAREEAEAKVTEERHRFRTVELGSLRGLLPLVLVLAACVDSPTEATPFVETDVPPAVLPLDLREPWVLASPTSQAMDADALARAALEAADISRVRSLLVVRNGRLVLEQYFRGNHADSLNDVRSVTKSVMSTLTGIALEQGHLSGLDQTLGDFLGPELEGLDPGKAEISIGDVLTMTTGLEWPENNGSQSAYNDWIRSGDWVSHVLGQPLVDPPGSRFNYNSGAIHLLGIVLERATGQRLPDFADAHLFGPMGVDRVAWEAFSDGTFNGGAGIDIRPRDLARFGQLFLQDGHDGLHQRVPLAWVRTASRPAFSWQASYGTLSALSYGFLWWTNGELPDAFFAWGYGGQLVYVVPSLQLVVVTTTEWRGLSAEGGPDALTQSLLELVVDGIVPAAF